MSEQKNNEEEEQSFTQTKWDLRFLSLAREISKWSKDPSTRCGAVIVDSSKRIVSLGYNGFPLKVNDDPDRYIDRDLKYQLVVHAEMNALLFSRGLTDNCTIYTYPIPVCIRCCVHVIQAKIHRVVSIRLDKEREIRWGKDMELASEIMEEAGVSISLYSEDSI